MKNELEIMHSSAKITKKSHAGHGQESKWGIPTIIFCGGFAGLKLIPLRVNNVEPTLWSHAI
jgi:hypothetical protein